VEGNRAICFVEALQGRSITSVPIVRARPRRGACSIRINIPRNHEKGHRMSFQLPPSVVDSLLDRLGNDDDFRDQFRADPRSALASLGFSPAADPSIKQGIWACMAVNELASKHAIRATRDQLREQLSRKVMFTPFFLEVQSRSHVA
jgi:putative modified peptide